ncbi:MAG: hypothetical protein A3I26_03815 [Candidatus Yanofskybacteria bacterium RIFCSPLOWO2_02_FULL_43_10]|uniref:Uncharacterized protein n=1 Tax=Candidatus Yanofskybacteria bacterium RIFCSPLOWO2_12_FULL_43_11b TaxID=1802710 RepID=A0A1F8H9X9_9BACT|nr:MAG: hypothetical protein A2742_01935 [Candidatus Yanofskybacteria bacterium RIFCSPHIGHO2_01_FULL_43_32]OGN10743.1 MAG: hypothetical protein A3C69_03940 [Candidatus Yanofskybacteria bacterium RIFCSPHIGHO2_02_FULL_43_12]OGN17353.1 MAG: hypothetical protein A3E34_00515 [Candidatus Yanofskybacteria bacterium RIFCSPHIGHO2_12_FULL_43_11]OGN29908.1 MAG: hypothetical protein A3I26_03815 [Candidatus Yanofskybacteria bacterium RIFCSPLOWO2_02_FULL_43_10]OGN34383.1 MAG: hypothetical protein A3G51_03270
MPIIKFDAEINSAFLYKNLLSLAPSLLCHFDEARKQMRLVDFIDFQNNRSSAEHILICEEASVGYLLFWF